MKGTSGSETLQNPEEAQLPELVLIGTFREYDRFPSTNLPNGANKKWREFGAHPQARGD
jgi:hypothetical protein